MCSGYCADWRANPGRAGARGVKEAAHFRQTLQRIESRAMAVGPLVVAGCQQEGRLEPRELLCARLEPCVGAGTVAAGDVADVHHEGRLLAVDPVDHGVEEVRVRLRVRDVAEEREH